MNTKNKKRITFMSIFVSLTIVLTLNFTTTAFASNIDKFTDNNFRNYVLNNFDLDGDNEISTEEAEQVKKIDIQDNHLANLKLLKADAISLRDVFEKGEVNRIYLNFSDPWPKKRHTKRRLTSPAFLEVFQDILVLDGELILKTDNRLLFEYSLVSFQNYGLHFEDVCLYLHHSEGYEDNIQTEYERKFSPFGPIYQVKTTFKGVNKNG